MRSIVFVAFLFALYGRAAEMEAPPGYTVHDLWSVGGQILVPAGWVFREGSTPGGPMFTISKENNTDGTYETGMRIQVIGHIKENAGVTAKEAVDLNIRRKKSLEKVISECPPAQSGPFNRICLETTVHEGDKTPQREYHCIYSFWWSDDLDLMIAATFGAPANEWDSASLIYAVIKDFKLVDRERAEKPKTTGPQPTADASPKPDETASSKFGTPNDASIKAIAKIESVQFINSTKELPKRLGSDVKPFAQYVNALESATATYLKANKISKSFVATTMVGLPNKGRRRVWLTGWEQALSPAQQQQLIDQLVAVPAPRVATGPVAFNLAFDLNGAPAARIDPAKMQLPAEWIAAVKGSKQPIALPDDLPASLWAPLEPAK
jgi:hypothetical protein